MRTVTNITCGVLGVVGTIALVSFDRFKDWFLFLSPDRDVTPFMSQLLQILLVAAGLLAIIVMVWGYIFKLLVRLDSFLATMDRKRFLIRLLSLAVLLRAAVVFLMPFNLWQDYEYYDELGWWWASDGSYNVGGQRTAYWPPGYPFFLSRLYLLFGHEPFIAAVVNILFGTLIVLLAYLIVRRIWNERTARWTVVIMAVFPSQVFFTNILATEMLFTPLLLLSILLFMIGSRHSRWWLMVLVGGVTLGLATLTRSITSLYIIPIAIYWLLQTKSLKGTGLRAGLALMGFYLVVTPWMIRTYHAVGRASISTNTGINLYIGNQPSSGMGYNHHAALDFELGDPSQEAFIDSAAAVKAWEYIRERPWRFVGRGFFKVAYFYAVDVDPLDYGLFEAADTGAPNGYFVLAILTEAFYLAVLLLGWLGLLRMVRSRPSLNPGVMLLLLTVLYWTGVHFVFFGMGRFHFPLIPVISGFAALYLTIRFDEHASIGQADIVKTN